MRDTCNIVALAQVEPLPVGIRRSMEKTASIEVSRVPEPSLAGR